MHELNNLGSDKAPRALADTLLLQTDNEMCESQVRHCEANRARLLA